MTANAIILDLQPSGNPDLATHLIQFTATDDPRSAQVTADVDMTKTQDEIKLAVRQAVADYINLVRGENVISVDDVKLL